MGGIEMIELPTFTDITEETTEQNNAQWFSDRLGKFTGSRMHELMSCSSKAKGKDWTNPLWLYDFGDTALNYINERAIERVTGENIESATTWQMNWGNTYEPFGKEAVAKKFGAITQVGFEHFAENAGASADGLIGDMAFELKCPATLKAHRENLTTRIITESHPYFWQMQSEMLALKVDKLLFASYHPKYPPLSQLITIEVHKSYIHCVAILERVRIANWLVKKIIESHFLCDDREEIKKLTP